MSKVTIVNNKDEVIGAEEKRVALDSGLIRRNSRIFLFNNKGQIFLQRRSATNYPFPNRWTESAGGHVDPGETYDQAAERELKEEIGMEGLSLEKIDYFYDEEKFDDKIAKKFNTIYKALYDGQDFKFQQEEVKDGRWFEVNKVDEIMEADPDQFPPGCVFAWKRNRSKF